MRSGAVDLPDAAATAAIGAALAEQVQAGDVVALSGSLGTGKTSLVRGLLERLGFIGDVPSPSYPLMITYEPPEVRIALWHVDLYRIDRPGEIEELGLEDARATAVLAIEWPDRMGDALAADALCLTLAHAGQGRRLTWRAPAAWNGRWPPPPR